MPTKGTIINVTLSGTEQKVTAMNGYYAEITNHTGNTIYASTKPGITPGNRDVMPILSGCKGILSFKINSRNLYLLGEGNVSILGTDYPSPNAEAISPNLLINSDFRNPVNQRGLLEYSAAGYTIDRWRVSTNGALIINNHSITVASLNDSPTYFLQIFEDYYMLDGMDVTLSVCDENNNITTSTGKVPAGDMKQTTQILATKIGTGQFILWKRSDGKLLLQAHVAAGESITMKWAKLEIGTKYTSFSPPDFNTELTKCQRFYQLYSTDSIKAIDLRPPMRTAPTISAIDGGFAYSAEIS